MNILFSGFARISFLSSCKVLSSVFNFFWSYLILHTHSVCSLMLNIKQLVFPSDQCCCWLKITRKLPQLLILRDYLGYRIFIIKEKCSLSSSFLRAYMIKILDSSRSESQGNCINACWPTVQQDLKILAKSFRINLKLN